MDKAAYWTGQIENQLKSGLSQQAYCEANGLNIHTLTYWKQKLNGSKGSSKKKFVSVKVKEASNSRYELEMPSGYKIKFDCEFEVGELKKIMDLVK